MYEKYMSAVLANLYSHKYGILWEYDIYKYELNFSGSILIQMQEISS